MVDTRQHSLIEMNKQLEEQNNKIEAIRSELGEKTEALRSELGGKLANLENLMINFFSQATNPVRSVESGPSSPNIISSSPPHVQPPDPPDFNPSSPNIISSSPPHVRPSNPLDFSPSNQISVEKNRLEAQRVPLLPNGMVTRLSKIEFPKFDGTLLREWIYKCEQFFMLDNTPPELKVRLASLHMKGKALQWHHNYITNQYGIFPSWPEYIVAVSARFSGLYDDPLSELVSLKQLDDSIEDYLEKFECALTRLSLPVAHALSIFLTNMNPHLALHARQFNITNIADAARIAKLRESSLLYTPDRQYGAPFSPIQKSSSASYFLDNNTTPILPTPELPKTNQLKPNFIPKVTIDKTHKKFSYEEMQARKTKGLCMFCEEPYTPGHHLKHRRSQIFVMECDDEKHLEEAFMVPIGKRSGSKRRTEFRYRGLILGSGKTF